MQVVAADGNGAVHLRGEDCAGENATTDGNIAGERALLVNVCACLSKQMSGFSDRLGRQSQASTQEEHVHPDSVEK